MHDQRMVAVCIQREHRQPLDKLHEPRKGGVEIEMSRQRRKHVVNTSAPNTHVQDPCGQSQAIQKHACHPGFAYAEEEVCAGSVIHLRNSDVKVHNTRACHPNPKPQHRQIQPP